MLRSIISSAAGMTPSAMMACTTADASATDVKSSSMVRTSGGRGVRRSSTRVTTPTVPSAPTTTPRRS